MGKSDEIGDFDIVQERGLAFHSSGTIPWTEVYIKLKVAFRESALRELKGAPLAVFLCIALHADQDGASSPTIETIMKETGYREGAVCSATAKLVRLGLIEKQRQQRGPTIYHIKGYAWFGKMSQPALWEEHGEEHGDKDSRFAKTAKQERSEGLILRKPQNEDSHFAKTANMDHDGDDGHHGNHHHQDNLTLRKPQNEDSRFAKTAKRELIWEALDRLEISEPTRSEIARLPYATPEYLLAWADWFESQSSKGPGWVVLQIRAGLQPPTSKQRRQRQRQQVYAQYAQLSDQPPQLEPPELSEDEQLWSAVLGELELQMSRDTFDTLLRSSRLLEHRAEDGVHVIGVKSSYAKDWLENRLLTTIERTLARHAGRSVVKVEFKVRG